MLRCDPKECAVLVDERHQLEYTGGAECQCKGKAIVALRHSGQL